MALDIYLQPTAKAPRRGDNCELIASLKDDLTQFLTPFFKELKRETGQNIDSYSDAVFRGDDLRDLEMTIKQVRKDIESRPERWQVSSVIQTFPTRKELFSSIEKANLNLVLDALESAIEKAQLRDWCITFWGD